MIQREVHYDTYSFNAALRSALREDPDVVLIGEMRDLETISAAITIAETDTWFSRHFTPTVPRSQLTAWLTFSSPHQQPQIKAQLANILQAIMAQRLIPSIGGGRIVASEILIANSAVRNIIREGKSHQLDNVIQTSSDEGMQSMDRTLQNLVQSGQITYDEAKNYAVDLTEMERMMRG